VALGLSRLYLPSGKCAAILADCSDSAQRAPKSACRDLPVFSQADGCGYAGQDGILRGGCQPPLSLYLAKLYK